jgi:acyl-CoA reductase-like NAD-dependent aldehyde dehydrogenase
VTHTEAPAVELYASRNPATGALLRSYPLHDQQEVDRRLDRVFHAWRALRRTSVEERAQMLLKLAEHFDENLERYARLVTEEMGRPLADSRAEIAKCALTCRTLATRGAAWLEPIMVETEVRRSETRFESLGPILGVMPWNYPFNQVMRYFAPAFLAGNSTIVKHAENVPGCAEAIEEAFASMGAPDGTLLNLRVAREDVAAIIDDPRIRSVTFTGSVGAGRLVAQRAGAVGKKSVLELGGSDPFIVLEDADLSRAVPAAVQARFANAGQSCICGKRFLLHERISDEFLHAFTNAVSALRVGDPFDETTRIGPLARHDLRAALHGQVRATLAMGGTAVVGGTLPDGPGYFYDPTILVDVPPSSPAGCQELFGPVATVSTFADDQEALRIANDTEFGLGSSVWTADDDRAARFITDIEAGAVFVNDVVRSDPRLSFGGIKASGYGRELGQLGTREFTNPKMVWVV